MRMDAKIKCILGFNPGSGATKGKTYKVSEGKLEYDNGQKSFHEFENIEMLNKYNKAQFKELGRRGRPKKEDK
jgi:hypothetical protein